MDVNTPSAIRTHFADARLAWWPVLAFLPARLVFAFIAQGLEAAVFALLGAAQPWERASAWWPVHLTLADALCWLSLFWLTRREGLRLTQLWGVTDWRAALRQLVWTPAYLLAVAPGVVIANQVTNAFYGAQLPPMLAVVDLPLPGALYALLVWPVVWVVTEELVYLGYLLPRLEALTGKTWAAILIVIFFWGLQHVSMPFIADARYLVARVLAALAAISCFPIVFVLWRRRLIPLMGVHYLADLATAILVAVLPLMEGA